MLTLQLGKHNVALERFVLLRNHIKHVVSDYQNMRPGGPRNKSIQLNLQDCALKYLLTHGAVFRRCSLVGFPALAFGTVILRLDQQNRIHELVWV